MKILNQSPRLIVAAVLSLFLFSVILYSQEEKTPVAGSHPKEVIPGLITAAKTEPPQVIGDKAEVDPDLIKKAIPSYNTRLKEILKTAEDNIKKVDKEIAQREIRIRNEERELKIREAFESGNELHKKGDLKEAKEAWQTALGISKDPEMRDYIKQSDKK